MAPSSLRIDRPHAAQDNPKHEVLRKIAAPYSINHRYLLEDVPTGFVPLSSLAEKFGVETPLIDMVIDLASVACGVDFRVEGRTLRTLGMECQTMEEFRAIVQGDMVSRMVSRGEHELLSDM